MWSIKATFCVFAIFILGQVEAKTYYFNLNKTSNEYMIRNRVNYNSTVYNNPSSTYVSELRNVRPNITRNNSKVNTHPLLDPEWNYNWTNITTRHKLPTYIYKFYDSFSHNIGGTVRILFNANSQNSTILKFNISYPNISDVELHFYHKVDTNSYQKPLILRLYQMENDFVNESSLINPDSHKLLNVIYIYQAENGWQVFKLTKALYNWLKEPSTDLVLFITISKPNDELFSLFKDTNTDVFRTFLILKTESSDNGLSKNKEIIESNNSCKKHDLFVDFEKLNWMKFIISPQGYNAYNCYGTCYNNENLPNHIKVTNFLPVTSRKTPCCGPVQYLPLPIMFYDKNGNVVIKSYEDMVISSCGCR